MALEIGAIHLILACLSALSHHAPRNPNASSSVSEVRPKCIQTTPREQKVHKAQEESLFMSEAGWNNATFIHSFQLLWKHTIHNILLGRGQLHRWFLLDKCLKIFGWYKCLKLECSCWPPNWGFIKSYCHWWDDSNSFSLSFGDCLSLCSWLCVEIK